MLIAPLVLYSLVASFALRVYYNKRLMLVSKEAHEAELAKWRRRGAIIFVVICGFALESDLGTYADWWITQAMWWKFTIGLLVLAAFWVLKESTYKTQVLWHHYKPTDGTPIASMHRPKLASSIVLNTIFWVFFLTYPGLPFYSCMIRPVIQGS